MGTNSGTLSLTFLVRKSLNLSSAKEIMNLRDIWRSHPVEVKWRQ